MWFSYVVYISVDYVMLYTFQLILLGCMHFSWFCYAVYVLGSSVMLYTLQLIMLCCIHVS